MTPAVRGAHVPDLPDEQSCFVIRNIALTGLDALRFAWLAASTEPLAHRCIGAHGLSAMTAYLDAQLIELGYVTSRFAQIVQLPSLSHLSHGQSDTAEVKWQHIAWRIASARTGLYASAVSAPREQRSGRH